MLMTSVKFKQMAFVTSSFTFSPYFCNSLYQVYVPRLDKKHNSNRSQQEPSGGDHPLDHRDPHLGGPE